MLASALRKMSLLLALLTVVTPCALAQSRPTTPKPGSAERRAIVEALRPTIRKATKQNVIFRIDHLKVQNGWAFLRGKPVQPNGKPLDYRGTEYEEAIEQGAFDDGIYALLRKQRGAKWRVIVYNIGATDVVWSTWDYQYKAPRAIFR